MRSICMRFLPLAAFVLAVGAFGGVPAHADDDDDARYAWRAKPSVSNAGVISLTEFPRVPVDGSSTLARTRSGVGFVLNTTGLEASAPYTVWWVVFNRPRHLL